MALPVHWLIVYRQVFIKFDWLATSCGPQLFQSALTLWHRAIVVHVGVFRSGFFRSGLTIACFCELGSRRVDCLSDERRKYIYMNSRNIRAALDRAWHNNLSFCERDQRTWTDDLVLLMIGGGGRPAAVWKWTRSIFRAKKTANSSAVWLVAPVTSRLRPRKNLKEWMTSYS